LTILNPLHISHLKQEPVGNKQAAIVTIVDDNSSLSRISEDSEKLSSPSSPSTPIVETSKNKMTFNPDFGAIHKRKHFLMLFYFRFLVHEEPEFKQEPLREYVNENKSPVEATTASYFTSSK
jgi:hypothetical protein